MPCRVQGGSDCVFAPDLVDVTARVRQFKQDPHCRDPQFPYEDLFRGATYCSDRSAVLRLSQALAQHLSSLATETFMLQDVWRVVQRIQRGPLDLSEFIKQSGKDLVTKVATILICQCAQVACVVLSGSVNSAQIAREIRRSFPKRPLGGGFEALSKQLAGFVQDLKTGVVRSLTGFEAPPGYRRFVVSASRPSEKDANDFFRD